MLSNKRIHELLQGIKLELEAIPNKMPSTPPYILEILQHLLEMDIVDHGNRPYCPKCDQNAREIYSEELRKEYRWQNRFCIFDKSCEFSRRSFYDDSICLNCNIKYNIKSQEDKEK